LLVLGFLPAMGILSWYRLKRGKSLPPKKRRLRAMIIMQVTLLLWTLSVATHERVLLFPPDLPSASYWLAGMGWIFLLLFSIRRKWPTMDAARRQRLTLVLPENQGELFYWVWVSLLAGLTEECAYRGLAYALLWRMTNSAAISLAVCVVAFAVAHMTQGWRAALAVGIIGLVLHFAVFVTGSLYLAIGMHA